jgi:ABC-type Fe3+ transport system permease subunit
MPKSRQRQRRSSRPYAASPTKPKPKPSPGWYGYLVLGSILLGVLIIVLNYANFLLPGGTQQHWLWIGLGIIGLGFIAATRWR